MYRLASILLSVFLAGNLFAQELGKLEVPQPVSSQLKIHFPQAKRTIWYKENNQYVADFFLDKKGVEASFDRSGNLLRTESDVDSSALPAVSRQYIHSAYPAEQIRGSQKIIDNTGRITWKAFLKNRELV